MRVVSKAKRVRAKQEEETRDSEGGWRENRRGKVDVEMMREFVKVGDVDS